MLKELKPEYIFFDVGDTLLKKRTSINENLAKFFGMKTEKLEKKKEELIDTLPEDLKIKFNNVRTLEDQLKYFREFYKLLCKELGFEPTEKRIRKMLEYRLNEDMVLAEDCIPEVLETLKKKGYGLGIITNAFPSRRYFDLKIASLDKYFDPIIISSEVGVQKPNPKIYQIAMKEAGVSPEETMFVDNKIEFLEGANKAGIRYLTLINENKKAMEQIKDLNLKYKQLLIIDSIKELTHHL